MNNQKSSGGNIPVKGGAAAVPAKIQEEKAATSYGPTFIEAEKMFERMAQMTKDVASKAFEFFTERGGGFGRELEDWFKAETELLRPTPVEMTESDKNVTVRLAVAGFKPEEIDISVEDHLLMVRGKTEQKTKKEDEKTFYSEWKSDHFYRKLSLPQNVDADGAKAKLTDGVLEIVLPKTEPARARKVTIE